MNDAWVRIRDIVGGSVPVKELKKKKDSLFATYRGYCRKIQASLKSGAAVDDVYRPVWFAFDFMNSFLGSMFKCNQTITMDQETGSIEEENNSFATVKDQNSIEPLQTRHAIRRRDNPPELQIASKRMTEAFNNLNKIINNKPAKDSTEVEDECDVFGKLIAIKLKKLSEHKREDFMFDIHALFQGSHVERSPSVESFRTSIPKSTSHHSLTPSVSSNKRPKSSNTASNYNAATFSLRPHLSHSKSPNNIETCAEQQIVKTEVNESDEDSKNDDTAEELRVTDFQIPKLEVFNENLSDEEASDNVSKVSKKGEEESNLDETREKKLKNKRCKALANCKKRKLM